MESANRPCLVLTSWPVAQPIEPLVDALVGGRLAACVHVGPPGISVYRWQGAIESADERSVAIKTTRGRLAAAEACLRARHPYAVPEWLVVDLSGSGDYVAWMVASVTPGGAAGPASPADD